MSEKLSHAQRRQVRERQNFRCALCGGHHPPGDKGGCISVHHRIPRSRRGTNDPGNLVGLCRGPGTNECHTKTDYLTLEHQIPFEQIMEQGLEYLLSEYPKPDHYVNADRPVFLPQEGRPLYPTGGDD